VDDVASLGAGEDAAQVGRRRVQVGGLRRGRDPGESHHDGERQPGSAPPSGDERARFRRAAQAVGHIGTCVVEGKRTAQSDPLLEGDCGRTADLTP
jgi:hypothetical protein